VFENDTLTASDVGAIPTTEKGAANGVASLGADGRVVEEDALLHGWRTGNLIRGWYQGNASVMIPNNERLIAYPIVIYNDTTIDGIALEQTAARTGAGGCRLGIYKGNPNGTKSLILDAGAIDGLNVSLQIITVSPILTLKRGIYWLASVSQVVTGNVGTVRSLTGLNSSLTDISPIGSANLFVNGIILAESVSGPLPATISATPPSTTVVQSPPLVMLRKA
jgi:hypothetical protein